MASLASREILTATLRSLPLLPHFSDSADLPSHPHRDRWYTVPSEEQHASTIKHHVGAASPHRDQVGIYSVVISWAETKIVFDQTHFPDLEIGVIE